MKQLIACLVVGLLLGSSVTLYVDSRAYDRLKAHSDSVSTSANALALEAHRYADSMEAKVAKLAAMKRRVITQVIVDTLQAMEAESILVASKTAQDSIVSLKSEIVSLKSANGGLWDALAIANAQVAAEKQRGDSLLGKVDELNASVQDLTQRIAKLRGAPKWLKISTEVVKDVGLVWVGSQLAKR